MLLHVCANNAEFDVKSMCIKLIDVLSSHTSLIQMRIDTDLITYLSHVLLPSNMIRTTPAIPSCQTDKPAETTQADDMSSPQKGAGFKFFAYKEATVEEDQHSAGHHTDSFEMVDDPTSAGADKGFSKTHNNFGTKQKF